MAGLLGADEEQRSQQIGGITLGLAVAHRFAFWVATRLVSAGEFDQDDVELAAAQLAGTAAVAALASPCSSSRLRSSSTRPSWYAVAVLTVAVLIVELKNWLAGY